MAASRVLRSLRQLTTSVFSATYIGHELEIGRLAAENERKESFIYLAGIVLLLVVAFVIIRMFVKRVQLQRNVLSDIASMQSH